MNIARHIEKGALEHPGRPALIFEGCEISYRECNAEACRAAVALASNGVIAGDRVALLLSNCPDLVFAYLGALKLGAIAVSVNPALTRDELGFILQDSGAKAVVSTPDLRESIPPGPWRSLPGCAGAPAIKVESRAMQPGDPAAIVYTSGTTGRPKGATLSHSNVVRNAAAKQAYLGMQPADRGLLFLPLHHCFAQNAVLNAFLQAGATVILHRRFDVDRTLESIQRDGVTMFFGVPTTFHLLYEKLGRNAAGGIRLYFSAAAPLPMEMEVRWSAKFGKPIHQGYGLTETSPFASYNHRECARPGSIGTPIDGVEMKIVDPDTGIERPPGSRGEIVVRGHNVMLGYWNRPADTAAAIRDGWFHTRDIGWMNTDGYFFIEDRLDDMIITGGCNVYPAEIENTLLAHPAVYEAAVYGVPDPLLGERVQADVVLRPGRQADGPELRVFCRGRLAGAKAPGSFRFVQAIPKGPTGKILKRVLREEAAAASSCDNSTRRVTAKDAERWIADWLAANLYHAPTSLDRGIPFSTLGVDSMLSVQMVRALSAWLGRDLPVTAAWSFPSIEALAAHLAADAAGRFENVGIANQSIGQTDERALH